MTLNEFLTPLRGRWVAMGGNRWIDAKTARKVEAVTRQVIRAGCKIITGGAEGVDHAVMRFCLRAAPHPNPLPRGRGSSKAGEGRSKIVLPRGFLKIFLPYTIEKQFAHYRKLEGVRKATALQQTLFALKKKYPWALIENRRKFGTYRKAADARNRRIELPVQAMIIFKPQGSKGSTDAVNAAQSRGLPHIVF